MAALTFSDFKTTLALQLGNMQTNDVFYTSLGPWINEALNGVMMRAISRTRQKANCFPELRDKWTIATSANTQYVNKPSDCLVVTDVFSFDSNGTIDENTSPRYFMKEMQSFRKYEPISHAAAAQYPRLWVKYSNRIQIYPTPTSANVTKLLILGIARENDLNAAGDTPVMDALWHQAVVQYAKWLGCKSMGWFDDAKEALDACDTMIQQTIDIMGLENSSGEVGITVTGDPTR